MLESLSIKNIALIDSCTIDFGRGLNILSGETGAGKSIILDSLGFILGARADKTLIRHGETSAEVKAIFDIRTNDKVKKSLDDNGIAIEDELIINRAMSIDGKNVCRVNGEKVTLGMLKTITNGLVDIYGQHDNNLLFDEENHIDILDNYLGNSILAMKNEVKEKYIALNEVKNKLNHIGSLKDVYKKIDILSYEIKEIKDANLEIGEDEELKRLSNKYSNVESILDGLNTAYSILSGDENESNVLSSLAIANRNIANLTEYDSEIEDINTALSDAISSLSDISRSVSILADSMEYDPYDAKRVEDRLDVIRTLERKYGNSIEEVLDYLEKIETEYDEYANVEENLNNLNIEYNNIAKELYISATRLSKARQQGATSFEADIVANLVELGMKNAKFKVSFSTVVDSYEDAEKIGQNGLDDVIFLISANLGQDVRPLDKVISGGELSRFMLSLKNIIAGNDNIDTMVFDEIDSGISGTIASVVAKKLYSISKDRQVLAVTHLPQLGAMADCHYLIEKGDIDNITKTSITLLDKDMKIAEIARLMGGDDGQLSMAHADELINKAISYKNSLS